MKIASIPGGPGAEQLPQAILDQGIHNRTGIEAGIAGMIPAMQRPLVSGGAKLPMRPDGSIMQPYVPPLPDFYKGFGEDDKTGIMYNDTFYRAADPRRNTMDMSPLDGLIASDPEFANRFRAGEFDFVKDPGNNATLMGPDGKPMQPQNVGGGAAMRPLPVEGPLDPATGLPSIFGDPTETAAPGSPGPDMGFGPSNMQPILTPGVDYDAQANPFHSQSPSQQPAFFPQQPQQPTGGFDSKAFANELLTGIGDLFKQHFPDSAQMAFNNSNQMQSQIEQPIQDATTFDVQPQQNMAFNPFSVNTLGGSFGGGY